MRETPAAGADDCIGFSQPSQMDQGFRETRVGACLLWSDLDQTFELQQRLFEKACREEQARQVGASRREAGVDPQCLVVVLGREVGPALALAQDAEAVMGLGDVGVQPPRAREQLLGAAEVAALELDQTLVGEGLDEARAVLERQAEAGIGAFQIPPSQGLDPRSVELGGASRQGRRARAAQERRKPKNDPQAERLHGPESVRRTAGCVRAKVGLPERPMSTESEPGQTEESTAEARPARAASDRPKKAKKKKSKRARLPIPQTEEEIDSPNRQTLGMLGVLCGLTLILWGFAHGACNYHPPKETRRPRNVATADLAREPKDAAIELGQRWATLNYSGAEELAKGPLLEELAREKASCAASAAECSRKQAARKKTVLTTGTLLEREPQTATVRVTHHGLDAGAKNYIVQVERDAAHWKATSRVVDDGTFKTRPSPGMGVSVAPGPMPRPAASGAVPAPPHPPHPGHENH